MRLSQGLGGASDPGEFTRVPISVSPQISATLFCEKACYRFFFQKKILKEIKKIAKYWRGLSPHLQDWEDTSPRPPSWCSLWPQCFERHPQVLRLSQRLEGGSDPEEFLRVQVTTQTGRRLEECECFSTVLGAPTAGERFGTGGAKNL